METKTSVQDNEKQLIDELRREARYLIIDSTYSARGHQSAGRRWLWWHHWLGIPTAILTTLLASGAAFSAAISDERWLTVTLASITAVLVAIQAFLRPGETAHEHGAKGGRYLSIRNETRLFLSLDLISDVSLTELTAKMKDLRQRYNDLNETAPLHIPKQDYAAAKASIEAGESSYENDPLWKELTGGKDS